MSTCLQLRVSLVPWRDSFMHKCRDTFKCDHTWHVLQCVAVCYNVLQCIVVCCRHDSFTCKWHDTFICDHTWHVLQCVAVCCNVLQCVAVCCRHDSLVRDHTLHDQCIQDILIHMTHIYRTWIWIVSRYVDVTHETHWLPWPMYTWHIGSYLDTILKRNKMQFEASVCARQLRLEQPITLHIYPYIHTYNMSIHEVLCRCWW